MTVRSGALSSLVLAMACALAAAACDGVQIGSGPPVADPLPSGDATDPIPRLERGPHLGMIVGFDALNDEQSRRADDLFAQARSAGQSIGRIQVDWSDLEDERGLYRSVPLAELLANPRLDGLSLMVTLSTFDSEGVTAPAYLGDDLTTSQARKAFRDFLGWLAGELTDAPVFALSLGNEVDIPVEDGFATEAQAASFLVGGADHWTSLGTDIAVTTTLTGGGPERTPDLYADLREASDFVTFNYYCLDAALFATDEEQWLADIERLRAGAAGKPVFFQELGCPASTALGSSDARQASFIEVVASEILADDQLRGATVFQLLDWSPELAAQSASALRDEGFPDLADRFEAWLKTVGLCPWVDGPCRPGWAAYRDALDDARRMRD